MDVNSHEPFEMRKRSALGGGPRGGVGAATIDCRLGGGWLGGIGVIGPPATWIQQF